MQIKLNLKKKYNKFNKKLLNKLKFNKILTKNSRNLIYLRLDSVIKVLSKLIRIIILKYFLTILLKV